MRKYNKILISLMLPFIMISCSKDTVANKDEVSINTNPEIKVTIDEAKKIISENKDLVILDVRTKEEYDAGHLENAVLIPYDEIEKNIGKIDKYKNVPLLVYCRTGRRSAIAVKTLIDNGFTKIYHMYEGYSSYK